MPWSIGLAASRRLRLLLEPKIIQGFGDRTVSYRHNLPVLERIYPRGQIQIIPPARHHLVNETPDIQAAIWQRLDQACDWTTYCGETHGL